MQFFNHYMATYNAYIHSPLLYVIAVPSIVLWVYLFKNRRFGESIILSFFSSVFASAFFWSHW